MIHFEAIPEPVAATIRAFLRPHRLDLCMYGEGAVLPENSSSRMIAWGCAPQHPSHEVLARPCSLQAIERAVLMPAAASTQQPEAIALWEQWQLDIMRKQFQHPLKASIDLTDKEIALLAFLMARAGEVIEKAPLLEAVWGYAEMIDTRTLETHIYRLRQKLEITSPPAGFGIVTDTEGYRWQG